MREYPDLTLVQYNLLQFIKTYQHINGRSPTFREMMNVMEWHSTFIVYKTIGVLINKGYVLKPYCGHVEVIHK